jgi:hypothetical protein
MPLPGYASTFAVQTSIFLKACSVLLVNLAGRSLGVVAKVCRASRLCRHSRSPKSEHRFRWSQFWSHSLTSGKVQLKPTRTAVAGGGTRRPSLDPEAQTWKACWGQPLRSSNLLSSATPRPAQRRRLRCRV